MFRWLKALTQSPEGKLFIDPGVMSLCGTNYPPSGNINPVAFASAASLANVVNAAICYVTGTNAMTGLRLPRGFRGLVCLIPSAAANGTTGGTLAYSADGLTEDIPFAVGWVGAANKAALFVSDGVKLYPVVLTAAG